MKPELSELRKWLQTLLKKQNRARLALVLGCIAMALISKLEILFLDEPGLGVDVRARRELWRIPQTATASRQRHRAVPPLFFAMHSL